MLPTDPERSRSLARFRQQFYGDHRSAIKARYVAPRCTTVKITPYLVAQALVIELTLTSTYGSDDANNVID